jgi:hypothetical protein
METEVLKFNSVPLSECMPTAYDTQTLTYRYTEQKQVKTKQN